MAISDRELSLEQKKLAERYGSEILALNNADQTFLINLGYVTGSDTLNVDVDGNLVFRTYRQANEIADGFEFKPLEFFNWIFNKSSANPNNPKLNETNIKVNI